MNLAQHFSAGSRRAYYSKAREAGDRCLTKRNSVVRFADSIIKYEQNPSAKALGYFQTSVTRTKPLLFLLLRYPLAGHLARVIKIAGELSVDDNGHHRNLPTATLKHDRELPFLPRAVRDVRGSEL